MARLDDDAARVLALLTALGPGDISAMQPQAVRDHYAAFPTMPGPDVHEIRDLSVAGADGLLSARLYRPSGDDRLPILVWFHGGGMVLGDLRSADTVCRALCLQAETVVLSVAYRLAPEHRFPAAPEDAYAALGWAVANAAELGGDPTRVSVGGDSAGGTLAAVCCLLARDRGGPSIRGQLLVYPGVDPDLTRASVAEFAAGPVLTLDGMLWFRRHYHASDDELLDPRANPALAANHEGLPAACVLTAEVDPIRDAGENYAALLARAGVLTTMRRYRGVYHGFFTMGASVAKTREAVADAARFLRTV
jgi:acetyl esterase